MRKINFKGQLNHYPIEVIKNISEVIELLDENYGEDRDIDNDLGGYVLIAENIVDIHTHQANNSKFCIMI